MGEMLTSDETLSPEEVERQKDEFLRRAAALPELFDNSDLPSMEAYAKASLTLWAPKGWKFNVYRRDGSARSTTMGRFRDYHSAVGSKDFDSSEPLQVDKITAMLEMWPAKDQPELSLTFETSDPAYYDSYTSYGNPDELIIGVEQIEND